MTFAEKLRELREGAGLSEARLAKLSGVSFGAVHNYGLGIRNPTFAAVVSIARALGVTCEAFADCEDVANQFSGQASSDESPAAQRLPAKRSPKVKRGEDQADKKPPARRRNKTSRES